MQTSSDRCRGPHHRGVVRSHGSCLNIRLECIAGREHAGLRGHSDSDSDTDTDTHADTHTGSAEEPAIRVGGPGPRGAGAEANRCTGGAARTHEAAAADADPTRDPSAINSRRNSVTRRDSLTHRACDRSSCADLTSGRDPHAGQDADVRNTVAHAQADTDTDGNSHPETVGGAHVEADTHPDRQAHADG